MDQPPPAHPTEVERSRLPLGRAAFLGTIAAGIVGVAALSQLGGPGVGGLLAQAGDAVGAAGIVPTGGWRIYNVQDPMPVFDPASYALRIDGAVERPITLTWQQVRDTPQIVRTSDFHCVTGWSVENVRWRGIAPQTIVDLVGPLPSARHVTFQSLEKPYVDQLTLAQFHLPDVLLATAMDGAPLTRAHGAPLRLVIPQMYGYKGVKWLARIRFDEKPAAGYWEQRGYDADAWVGRDAYR